MSLPGRLKGFGSFRQTGDLENGTDLDRPFARAGNARGDGDRLVEVGRLDEEIASELLARFGERTVGDEPLAVANLHARRRRHRLQWRCGQVAPLGVELMRQGSGLGVAVL